MQEKHQNIPTMLSISEASTVTGLSEYALRRLVKNGQLVVLRVGRKSLINLDKLIDFLNLGNGSERVSDTEQFGIKPVPINLR